MKNLKSLIFVLATFLMTSCSQVFYQPTRVLYSSPEELGLSYENIYFEAQDKTRLHGWLLKSSREIEKQGLVLFFHGNAQNLTSHHFHLQWMTEFGWDVFIFDYRGYGLSQGSPNQQGVHKDALAAIELAYGWKQEKAYPKLVLYSQSLGGIIAARALESIPSLAPFDLVIFDATFSSYVGIARYKTNSIWPLKVLTPLVPLLISDEFSPTTIYGDLEMPVLVIHSKTDPVVEYVHGEKIYSMLSTSKKWFWTIEEGAHGDTFFSHRHRYRHDLIHLLKTEI